MRTPILLTILLALHLTPAFAETLNMEWREGQPRSPLQEFAIRSNSVHALLDAYRSVRGVTRSMEFEQHIEGLVNQAGQHLKDGDHESGRAVLDQAYTQIKKAVVEGRDGDTLFNKKARAEQYQVRAGTPVSAIQYQARKDSIDALYSAYNRVAEEKALPQHRDRMTSNMQALTNRAEQYQRDGDTRQAQSVLDSAYTLIKESLSSLRDGETLVRSLNFETPKDEYAYYVDKTNSQKTAIQILLELDEAPSRHSLMSMLLQGVEVELEQAGREAAAGNYDRAIPVMDRVFTRLQSGLIMSLSDN